MDDDRVVAAQIGRPLRARADAVTRCHLDLPVVTRVPPLLDDGTPFPTRYWLGCPLAVYRISRIESDGGIAEAEAMVESDPALRARLDAAHERYRSERDRRIGSDHEGPRPSGGIAGSGGGVKCLHAHYADYAAGNDNPIGAWVASKIEPLDCEVPCVAVIDEMTVRNPAWAPR